MWQLASDRVVCSFILWYFVLLMCLYPFSVAVTFVGDGALHLDCFFVTLCLFVGLIFYVLFFLFSFWLFGVWFAIVCVSPCHCNFLCSRCSMWNGQKLSWPPETLVLPRGAAMHTEEPQADLAADNPWGLPGTPLTSSPSKTCKHSHSCGKAQKHKRQAKGKKGEEGKPPRRDGSMAKCWPQRV